jgi:cardiolipin synthase A/B
MLHLQDDDRCLANPVPPAGVDILLEGAKTRPTTEMEESIRTYSIFSSLLLFADLFIRITLSIRVIMRRRPYGVNLAWLVVVLVVPFLGGFFYLLFGENRISERRTERAKLSHDLYLQWLISLRKRAPVSWGAPLPECSSLHRQAESLAGLPAMAGNDLSLLTSPDAILSAITEAIAQATSTCHLQFYIWEDGGRVAAVTKALQEAAARGVTCRLLLDAVGSSAFLKSPRAEEMRRSGIEVLEALPAGLIKALFWRIDIRNHRKIVVIDGEIAFTGSQNMVDPDVFKSDAGVGNWIDVMVKIRGPVVESLAGTFIADWLLETETGRLHPELLLEDIETILAGSDIKACPVAGDMAVQLVPSGPGFVSETIHSLLLTTIYTARQELVLTTPYFIPDEPLLAALKAAAQRGVVVKIIVPEKNDSWLVRHASHARYEELIESGVQIHLFSGGLLHAKSITVDGTVSLFGSANLDMRSFWLNFEATLFIYNTPFTLQLLELQHDYLRQSTAVELESFRQRGALVKFGENVALLISPLL